MKKIVFLFVLISFISVFSERYIVRLPYSTYGIKSSKIIRNFPKYNALVIDDSIDNIRKSYPDALVIEKDPKVKAFADPNDTYYNYQWSMQESHYNLPFLLSRGITGSKSVVIGILDTGVSYEDYAIPAGESGKVISSDGEYHKYDDFSSINFVQGYDFVSGDEHPNDMNGHGTAVAAVIGATINNSLATCGIIQNASIMPIRVLDENGDGYVTDVLSGIEYAMDKGCMILNLSLGGAPGDSVGWDLLHAAIAEARSRNIAVVCASGNDGVNELSYPAGFPEAVAVGAVDFFMDRAAYSQYGDNLDFVAPGGDVYQNIDSDPEIEGGIIVPMPEQTASGADVSSFYLYFIDGTSFSAPHISGLMGLLYASGYTDIDEMISKMADYSIDLGASGYDNVYGFGYPSPEKIFSENATLKIISYSALSSAFSVMINPENDSVTVDSAVLTGKLIREKVYLKKSGASYIADISGLNSGVYTFSAFTQKADTAQTVSRTVAIKSPLDNTSVIFTGKSSIIFSGRFALVSLDRGYSLIDGSDGSAVVSYSTDKKVRIFYADNEIDADETPDAAIFSLQEGKLYRLYETAVKKEGFSYEPKKTLLLYTEGIKGIGEDGAEIYDEAGRSVKCRFENGTLYIDGNRRGLFFAKDKNGAVWKIVKF